MIREQQGMRLDIFRSYTSAKDTAGAIKALRKYGPEEPHLYPAALSYFTSSPKVMQEVGDELQRVLDKIDEDGLMAPLQVVQMLSENGVATVGMVKKYLRTTMERERNETARVSMIQYFFFFLLLLAVPDNVFYSYVFTLDCYAIGQKKKKNKTYKLRTGIPIRANIKNLKKTVESPPNRNLPSRHRHQTCRTGRAVFPSCHVHRHPVRLLRRRPRSANRAFHVQTLLSPALPGHCRRRGQYDQQKEWEKLSASTS